MLEITKEQLLKCDNAGRARILKFIAMGLIKYIGDGTNENRELSKHRTI